jgi:hypothetical protein
MLLDACPPSRLVDIPQDLDHEWISVRSSRPVPRQGWKLHVSATSPDAPRVLRAALSVLATEDVAFKVAGSPHMLTWLNQGLGGLSQIGKFITVYPADDAEAVRLASALHVATAGLQGPPVPSDRPLVAGSLVHYRFGGFSPRYVQRLTGHIIQAVISPSGELVADERLPRYSVREWAVDPFLVQGVAESVSDDSMLLAGRYLVAATLARASRGTVYLAADLESGRRCVLKRAHVGASMSSNGTDAQDRLRHEATVLRRLSPDPHIPEVYDLFEDGNALYLVLEDVPGRTLETIVREHLKKGTVPPIASSVQWARELADVLAWVHARGYVYRDVKSANVLLAPDGCIRLVDFELAWERGSRATSHGYGTPGYMSPQQVGEDVPSNADDIYGLGALLYFLLSGAEPSHAPDITNLSTRPLQLLNPAVDDQLAAVVNRCLAPERCDRFASMEELSLALETYQTSQHKSTPSQSVPPERFAQETDPQRYRRLARALGDALCEDARPVPGLPGVAWTSRLPSGAGAPYRFLNLGSGGAVLALAEIAGECGDGRHCDVLRAGATCLIAAPPVHGPRSPGLYAGEAGVGAALLRAGQVLDDADLIGAATERAQLVAALPHISPDLFNGTAGRLRFHLMLWDETRDAEQLYNAERAGDHLLSTAQRGDDELFWTASHEIASMAGRSFIGYAHGAAGIADALLDLYDATADRRYLDAAGDAGRWIAGKAVRTLHDGSGLDWPAVPEETTSDGTWCHGAAGIGRFLLHAAAHDAVPGAMDLAIGAARTVARGMRWAGPVLCHGLAGHIDLLLDVYRATSDDAYLEEAHDLARILDAFAVQRDGVVRWIADMPRTVSPDYMVGYAGIAVTLLRLADPLATPTQLSRAGFRRAARRSAFAFGAPSCA